MGTVIKVEENLDKSVFSKLVKENEAEILSLISKGLKERIGNIEN